MPTKTAKPAPAKAAAAKSEKAEPAKSGKAKADAAPAKKPAAGLAKPVTPSKELAAIVGSHAIPRTEVISKIWDYIRKHSLQNPTDKREILADAKLKTIFGKEKVTMFELNKLLSSHLH